MGKTRWGREGAGQQGAHAGWRVAEMQGRFQRAAGGCGRRQSRTRPQRVSPMW